MRKCNKYVKVVAFYLSVVPVRQMVRNIGSTEVPDAICQYLANHISTKWKMLGTQLLINTDVLDCIDYENHHVWDKSIMMLKMWREKCKDKATIEVLRKALENIGRNDLSKEVRGMSIPSSVNPLNSPNFSRKGKCSLR